MFTVVVYGGTCFVIGIGAPPPAGRSSKFISVLGGAPGTGSRIIMVTWSSPAMEGADAKNVEPAVGEEDTYVIVTGDVVAFE
jgi:hypothetical protein